MINKLIKRTNTPEFYNDCDLTLKSYTFDALNRICEVVITLNHNSYDSPEVNEIWKIIGSNAQKGHGFSTKILLPYTKLQLLDNHPLLWFYNKDVLTCEIQGIPNDLNKLVFDLVKILEKQAGDWIMLNAILGHFSNYMFKIPKIINIPATLEESLQQAFIAQELSFKVIDFNTDDYDYEQDSDMKVLIFGNEDVCPNRLNGSQPYIIAKDFTAERIK